MARPPAKRGSGGEGESPRILKGLLSDARRVERARLGHERTVAVRELLDQIGRASCRERVVSVRVDLGGRRIIKKKNRQTRIDTTRLSNKTTIKHNELKHT